jgi:hypothetical protein
MNRQQRKAFEKQMAKQGLNPNQIQGDMALKIGGIVEQLQALHKQNVKITEFNRKIFGSITKLKEALERKGVITAQDFDEVETLYLQMLPRREAKIKEIVASEMADEEKIKFCLDDLNSKSHGYDKYNILPVRDLNVAPGTVLEYLQSMEYPAETLKILAIGLGVPEVMLVKKEAHVRQT